MTTMMGPRQVDQAALFYEFSLGRAQMIPMLCREGEEGQEGVPALGQALRPCGIWCRPAMAGFAKGIGFADHASLGGSAHHALRSNPDYPMEARDHAGLSRGGTNQKRVGTVGSMTNPFFTIGHSTRPVPEFVDLLHSSQVQFVVDVRTMPRSRTNPQFNFDALPTSLAEFQIGYEHIAELGGLRGKQRAIDGSPNLFWENRSFRNYADYAMTVPFRAGLARLHALGRERRCAIMCAEAVWWRCHRRIIADYLIAAGESVLHILGAGKVEAARLTPAVEHRPGSMLVYPPGPEN